MASHEDVKGEGFEVLGHEEPESPDSRPQQDTPEAEAPEQEPEAPPSEADTAPQEQPRPLDVYAVLRVSIAQLAGVAWQMMGLQADPFTNKLHKDIEQARIAIDATAALVEKLVPHIQGQEIRDYQNLLTDLRLNFVTQSSGDQEKKT